MNALGSYVVGLDNGGTANKFTVMDRDGNFLIDRLVELPSRVTEGPAAAIGALHEAFDAAVELAGVARREVLGVGLDTPGPATADGVISSRGGTNFGHGEWRGYDVRIALEDELGLPVVYNNDANAAALYAHHRHFGAVGGERSSISVIVGTGLGGGLVESGRVVKGAAGMAGELGHVHIPMDGLLADDQPVPRLQLRLRRRRGERGVAHRHLQEPPALLADAVPGSRTCGHGAARSRQAGAGLR
jgi:glucokinase